MPTYSYRCAACNHTFDKVQRITEDAIKTCPSCGADAATRLITSGNFMLKGGGWYGDLYSGSSNKKASAASSGESTATPVKSSGADSTTASPAPAAPASAPASAPAAAPSTSSTSSS